MRLRGWEIEAIRSAAREVFGPEARVRLFGSRLYDDRRGGDIDLYLDGSDACDDQQCRNSFARLLQMRLGEREIDILYASSGGAAGAMHQEALRHGVVL